MKALHRKNNNNNNNKYRFCGCCCVQLVSLNIHQLWEVRPFSIRCRMRQTIPGYLYSRDMAFDKNAPPLLYLAISCIFDEK